MKKKDTKGEKKKFSAERLLKNDNASVLKYVDGIKSINEKKDALTELVNYLDNCLLDRDAGTKGTKLIVQLKDKLAELDKNEKLTKIKSNEDKVWWKGSEPQIIYLFELLFNANLIDKSQYDSKYALIEANFKNRYGNSFDNNQLARATQNMNHSKSEGKPKKKDADEIESVIREMRDLLKNQSN